MNFDEAMDFYKSLPAFDPSMIAKGESIMNLDSLIELLRRLGDPQNELRYVHIAGTNGKGSTASFVSNILTKAGYKTGLYTSPAVICFEERIRIDGEYISREEVGYYTHIIKEKSLEMQRDGHRLPSEFEMVTAMSFMEFRDKGCDIAVMECGLGGIMDATNVIPAPELAIITAISYDHTEILGDSLGAIAAKKAGIIKKACDVLLYPADDEEVISVVRNACAAESARLRICSLPDRDSIQHSLDGQTFDLLCDESRLQDLRISLLGGYQVNNAAMAVNAAYILRNRGYNISDEAIRAGLADTSWPCRFELIGRKPVFIADGSHNLQGVTELADGLTSLFGDKKIIFITGVLSDKAYDKMMCRVIPLAKTFITVTPPSVRALDGGELRRRLMDLGAKDVISSPGIREAVRTAMGMADEDDVICAFGSLYYIGEIRELADEIRTGK